MLPDLLTALALVLVIEGIFYALFPDAMKRMMATILRISSSHLRSAGLLAAIIGLVIVWLIRL
ncbi:MAG: hypothetical protein CMM53_06860 [Rhodospirillaceae bacterium]|nr:hypothetical protein [Rhodospirillaceae bacterium]|tara:strand:+ start:879 stop:1067 length:189 start_codon:yes stop_codon:yes gene_type:complete